MKDLIEQAKTLTQGVSIDKALKALAQKFNGEIAFSTSFGFEDQVITHLIYSNLLPIEIFTLDTGRHFNETYSVWNRTNEIYSNKIKGYFPIADNVEKLLSEKGPFSFYESIENRKECCHIRKVEPLTRALKGVKIWVTGIRKGQSGARADLTQVEWDEQFQLVKFHPLFDWSFEEVKAFIDKNNIPYNSLHDRGFPSIGCAPCTRAIKPEEDVRAGRWWWEENSKKECGLHSK